MTENSTAAFLTNIFRLFYGCLQGGFVSGSDLERGGEGSERESEENVLLMLWAVSAEVDMQNCGACSFRVRLRPSSSASLFNYLKSKTVSLRVCENPVSLAASWRSHILQGQPCLCTGASVRLAPALGSFLSGDIV